MKETILTIYFGIGFGVFVYAMNTDIKEYRTFSHRHIGEWIFFLIAFLIIWPTVVINELKRRNGKSI